MTLYLPTERLHGVVLPVSIVASEPIEIPQVRPSSGPAAVLAALASVTPVLRRGNLTASPPYVRSETYPPMGTRASM